MYAQLDLLNLMVDAHLARQALNIIQQLDLVNKLVVLIKFMYFLLVNAKKALSEIMMEFV